MLTRTFAHHRLASAGVAAILGLALLTAYCQVFVGEEQVPIAVSFRWAVVTLSSWIFFAAVLWSWRERLTGWVEQGRLKDIVEAVGLVFGFALVVTLLSTVVSKAVFGDELLLSYLGRRLFTLSPLLLLVAVTTISSVAAWRWIQKGGAAREQPHSVVVAQRPSASEWIELPEAPLLRLRTSDVAVIRTARNYCELDVCGRAVLVRVTAKQLENRLAPLGFVRVHRGAIVNLSRVRAMQPGRSGQLRLLLDDGSEIVVSKSHRQAIVGRLSAANSAALVCQAA